MESEEEGEEGEEGEGEEVDDDATTTDEWAFDRRTDLARLAGGTLEPPRGNLPAQAPGDMTRIALLVAELESTRQRERENEHRRARKKKMLSERKEAEEERKKTSTLSSRPPPRFFFFRFRVAGVFDFFK